MTLLRPLFQGAAAGLGTNEPSSGVSRFDIITSDTFLDTLFNPTEIAGSFMSPYELIVRDQLWVRIAVNKIAYTIGRLPLKTYDLDDNGNRERAALSPLATLLQRPNETKETGQPTGFMARVVYDLMTYSNAIIIKSQRRPDVVPDALLPVSPRFWRVVDGTYHYSPPDGRDETVYQPWQIIHLIEPGPTSYGFGVSRLEAARLTLAIEYAAQKLGIATFRNGARPSSIINIKKTDMKKEVIDRFKAEVRSKFGGVENTGVPAVLEGDIDWKSQSYNFDDSAVVNHRQLTRMEVAALYDIPQPAIGILDESNFASVDALHLMFYQDSLGWPINLIEEVLASQLIAGVPEFAGQFVEFDLNAVMRGAFSERMQGYMNGINARIFTPDEVRAWENLPPMAGEQPEAGRLQFPLNYSTSPVPPGQRGPVNG